jgi:hypothetical protein
MSMPALRPSVLISSRGPVLDQVEHRHRPHRLALGPVRVDLGDGDRVAGDVADHRADAGRDDAVLDRRQVADRGDHDGRVLRRYLDDHAQLLRDVPALQLDEHGLVGGALRGGDVLRGLALLDPTVLVDLQVDAASRVAALVDPGLGPGVDQRHVVGPQVEVKGTGIERRAPHPDAVLRHQGRAQVAGIHARQVGDVRAIDAGAPDVALHHPDEAGRDHRRRPLLDLDLPQVTVEPVAAGLQHRLLRAADAAVAEKVLGVEHLLGHLGVEGRGDEHAVRHGLAVERGELAIAAVGHGDDAELLDVVEDLQQRDEMEAGTKDPRLRPLLAVDGDDPALGQVLGGIYALEMADGAGVDKDEGGARQRHQRQQDGGNAGDLPQDEQSPAPLAPPAGVGRVLRTGRSAAQQHGDAEDEQKDRYKKLCHDASSPPREAAAAAHVG